MASRMGRDRDRQDDRLARPQLLRDLGGRLDRRALARDHDLARGVAVRDAEHAVGGGSLDQRRQRGVFEAQDRGHRAVATGAGRLHQPAAFPHEPDPILEGDDVGSDEGGVLAHRVTRGEGGHRRIDPERAPALADGREIRDRYGKQRRLGVLGPIEEVGGSARGELADRFAEGGIGGGEDGCGGRGCGSERLSHADRL
jgi:hypothetical protein